MWYGWLLIQTDCYRGINRYLTKSSGMNEIEKDGEQLDTFVYKNTYI